jgi:hypothetical protein
MMQIKQKSWYPWLVVALLWMVALLNYMDRQMLSTMKSAIMDSQSSQRCLYYLCFIDL